MILFFLFLLGYGAGWALQKILMHIRPPMGSCNIGTKGTSWR